MLCYARESPLVYGSRTLVAIMSRNQKAEFISLINTIQEWVRYIEPSKPDHHDNNFIKLINLDEGFYSWLNKQLTTG